MKLSRQPCPTCKEDTLHRVMQCIACGHVNLSPAEQRRNARRVHACRVIYGYAPMAKSHAAERRKECAALPLGRLQNYAKADGR